jgi:SSS family solute:Na+ symporter
MLCASTIFTKDLYQKYINPNVDDNSLIKMTRISNVVIGLLAMCIALFQINIINLNIFSFMLRAAGPFAAFILGITFTKCSKHAGIVSILVGSAVGIYWQIAKEPFGILAIIAGTTASILAFLITSLIETKITKQYAPSLEAKE